MSLSTTERPLLDSIAQRQGALRQDLREFVEIPTGPRSEDGLHRLRDLLRRRLQALGGAATLIPGDAAPPWIGPAPAQPPPTLLVVGPRPAGLPRLLLSGHLDTVHDAHSDFRALTIAPGGRTATGPGVVDMKGGLVIALHALEALHAANAPAAWSFILNSDEETGSYASDRALREVARDHDAALALEPAMENGGLVVQRPASGQFMLEATGRAAHVGRDFASGVSAVTALAQRLVEISRLPDPARGLIASVGPIEGGHATNVVPDRARAWGNVRCPDAAGAAFLRAALGALATPGEPDASLAKGRAFVRVLTSFNRPPKPLTPATQRLADLARECSRDLGRDLPFGTTGGVCDGNNLQDAGLPTLDTLGVRGGGLHTPREWIELDSLVDRCQLLALLLLRLSHPGTIAIRA